LPETEIDLNDTVSQVLGLVRRQRRWIVSVACCTALATIGFALRLPDRYSSEAVLSVVQQQVSQRYVETGTTSTAAAMIQAMTRDVLSRTKLLGIINELGLYPDAGHTPPPEVLAGRMLKDLEIEPLDDVGRNDFRAFKITFTAATPQLAQAATTRLASLFIQETLKTQGDQAVRTNEFLTAEMEEAKKKLTEQEKRLQEFKIHNLSDLPEQQQSNLAVLTDRRMQLQNVAAGLSRIQQQRIMLESSIRSSLAILQSERSNLLTRFTPLHSQVIKKDREIALMAGLLERIRTGSGNSSEPVEANADPALARWQSQADSLATEGETLSPEKRRLEAEIAMYQSRVSLSPVREQQLAEIMRDYDSYKKRYSDLLSNQLQSQQTVSLEERREGQQFRLVDPPTLPVFPANPKRLKFSLGGIGGGIFLGLVVGFLMDVKKKCFHTEKEIVANYSLPLVVSVPFLPTAAEQRAQTWTKVADAVAGGLMMLVVVAAEFYVYRHG
jgi:succinoglycan biosynthesis transport protein ExoP